MAWELIVRPEKTWIGFANVMGSEGFILLINALMVKVSMPSTSEQQLESLGLGVVSLMIGCCIWNFGCWTTYVTLAVRAKVKRLRATQPELPAKKVTDSLPQSPVQSREDSYFPDPTKERPGTSCPGDNRTVITSLAMQTSFQFQSSEKGGSERIESSVENVSEVEASGNESQKEKEGTQLVQIIVSPEVEEPKEEEKLESEPEPKMRERPKTAIEGHPTKFFAEANDEIRSQDDAAAFKGINLIKTLTDNEE